MKTYKFILLSFVLSCSTMLMATDYQPSSATGGGYGGAIISAPGASYHVEMPDMQFHSTSTMQYSGSSWSSTTSDIGGNSSSSSEPGGRRNVGGFGDNNYGDPGAQPIGDIPWLMMALLVLGYALRVGKKYGNRLPDAGK